MPETLVERSAALRKGVEELPQLSRMASQARSFATRAGELSTPADELDVIAYYLELLRKHGLQIAVDRERANGLRTSVQRLATNYAESPEAILPADTQLRFGFWQSLRGLPNELREAILAAWAAYVTAQLPPRQDGLLQTLSGLPQAGADIRQVWELWQRAEALKRELPTQEGDLERPRELASQIERAMDRLTGGNLPAEVQAFIQAATSVAGAPLQLYTSDVEEWLTRTNNLHSVRMVLRSGT
jgi:hypothetical protein